VHLRAPRGEALPPRHRQRRRRNFPKHCLSRDDLRKAVDAGLYTAKQLGMNRVVMGALEQ